MEEKNIKKLNPVVEVLVIFLITLVCSYFLSFFYTLFDLIFLGPVIAALFCMKVIEKRKIEFWKIILISLGSNIIIKILDILFIVFLDVGILFNFAYAVRFLEKVLQVVLIVVFVNIFEGSIGKEKVSNVKGQFNLDLHILLLIFTFGIWRLIWIYRTTQYLNSIQEGKGRNPEVNLLLCIFVPFYSVYWMYESATQVEKLTKTEQSGSNLVTWCVILEIFLAFVPPILIQDKINKFIEKSQ